MDWYDERVVPRLVELACGTRGLRRWRQEMVTGLAGTVVEIGFGSGLNLEFYPEGVTDVVAVEPSDRAFRLARKRIDTSSVAVRRIGSDAQALALDDASCDHAVCSFSLCTIPDPGAALDEIRRVLRPGGQFRSLEHGAAPDQGVAVWQRRLEPMQRRLAGGCHLTRDPVALLEEAGFDVDRKDQQYGQGPKPWSYFSRIVASVPLP